MRNKHISFYINHLFKKDIEDFCEEFKIKKSLLVERALVYTFMSVPYDELIIYRFKRYKTPTQTYKMSVTLNKETMEILYKLSFEFGWNMSMAIKISLAYYLFNMNITNKLCCSTKH